MKRTRTTAILIGLALGALWLGGCSDEPAVTGTTVVGVDDYTALDLDAAYGGLTATDEPAAFGDPYFTAADFEDLDAASDDPLQNDPEVRAAEDAAGDPGAQNRPDITVLRLTWGQLGAGVEDIVETDDALDWSGMLRVDAGIAVVRRVILFERPRDHVVRPRINRHTVAWVSHTGPHYDGLIVEIIAPRGTPGGNDDPGAASGDDPVVPMLHLVTPLLELDIPLAALGGMDATHPVDDLGNALRLEGHRLADEELCPKGFLSGVWVAEEDPESGAAGYFKGRWVGLWGHLNGHLRGVYGVDEAGEPVFYGKLISRSGRFQGLLRGTYAIGEEPGHGVFDGVWVDDAETVQGRLGGEWIQMPERPAGFFSGRWATLCGEEPADP
jgi:hypothetical protein